MAEQSDFDLRRWRAWTFRTWRASVCAIIVAVVSIWKMKEEAIGSPQTNKDSWKFSSSSFVTIKTRRTKQNQKKRNGFVSLVIVISEKMRKFSKECWKYNDVASQNNDWHPRWMTDRLRIMSLHLKGLWFVRLCSLLLVDHEAAHLIVQFLFASTTSSRGDADRHTKRQQPPTFSRWSTRATYDLARRRAEAPCSSRRAGRPPPQAPPDPLLMMC